MDEIMKPLILEERFRNSGIVSIIAGVVMVIYGTNAEDTLVRYLGGGLSAVGGGLMFLRKKVDPFPGNGQG